MTQRWIDLSAHGLRLLVAELPSRRILVLENVGTEHQKSATALGFKKHEKSGNWIKPAEDDLNPRAFMRAFPKATLMKVSPEDITIRQAGSAKPSSAAAPSAVEPLAKMDDIPEALVLGFNRMGQKVGEEDGRRFIEDSRGRRMFEQATAAAMPGMFLRAIDEGSTAMCAEGYLETVIAAQGTPAASIDTFMKVAGLRKSDQAAFKSAVAESAIRHVIKKGGNSLRDKFAKALALQAGLSGFIEEDRHYDRVIVARRLMGADRELLGKSVAQADGLVTLMNGLLPRAVRTGGSLEEADISISVAGGKKDAANFLGKRASGSMSVCFVPADDSGHAREIVSDLAKFGPIEAAAFVNLGPDDRYVAMTAVAGKPSPAPDAVMEIADSAELWSWASLVASDRTRRIEAIKSGLSTDADLNAGDGSMAQNSHQMPYLSASKVGDPRTMVPKELAGPTREALDRIISNFGDVDGKVATECGFPSDRLGEYLSPEQVDGVALAIHAEDRDRAFLFADNTGVGKGRGLMALARRAVLQGKKVLVLSEKVSNLSDLMRDVKHLGALGDIRPAVMNRDEELIDEVTDQPFETADQGILLDAVQEGKWPDEINVVFSTYSQFNRPKEEVARSAWLHSAIDEDVLVIGDEIHNAASGGSNTSENVAAAVEAAGSVVLSSATFAASAQMMAFFQRLFPAGIQAEEIASMMRKGGEQFQEVVSSMLVADGVMIRREKDLSQLQISQHLDTERLQRNRDYMDALAAVIGEMAILSGSLDQITDEHNRSDGVLKGLQMKRTNFGSPLYTMTRLFTASLLAEYSAERAITALENGEKPIILVENTVQGVLDEALAAGGEAPLFKDVVHRILDQMTKLTVVNAEGEAERVDAANRNRAVADTVGHIKEMIDQLPEMPASAIDEVRKRVLDAGYSIGEITGRTLQIDQGRVVPRKDRDAIKTKNAFNRGDIDALIINSAGSTGIDLHASSRFKDQRRRVMIELQGPSYVLRQIQAYGRVARYDEVVASRIELPSTGLPSEVRLAAMRNQKLRRLSANVTSNRDSAFLTKNIPDLINSVGDTVISRYAEMRPDLLKRLCLDNKTEDDGEAATATNKSDDVTESQKDTDRSANEFLSRLSLLPTEHQEKVLSELTAEYEMHVQELEAQGENPLRPRELEGVVHIRQKALFEGTADAGANTAFDGPMHLMDVSIERIAQPISSDTVMAAVEEGAAAYGRTRKAASNLMRNRDLYLEPFLPKKARTVDDALALGNKKITQMVSNMKDVATALNALAPGREISIPTFDGEPTEAIITAIHPAFPGYEHLPHMYRVDLAVPGSTSIMSFRLGTLLQNLGVGTRNDAGELVINANEGLEGSDYDKVLDKFDNAVAKKLTSARILTTNIFRAVRIATQHNLGSLVSFVDSDGNRHRGVLVKKNFERRIDALSIRLSGVEESMQAVAELGVEINSSPSGSKSSVLISPMGNDTWALRLPAPAKRGGERRWLSEGYRSLYEAGNEDDKLRKSTSRIEGEENLRHVLDVLTDVGISAFYVSSKHRSLFINHDDTGTNFRMSA